MVSAPIRNTRKVKMKRGYSQVFPTNIKYVPNAVKICHHECPSSRNAAGQPRLCFHPVKVPQKILSMFQIKNPNAKMPAPLLKTFAMVDLRWAGICCELGA